MIQCISAVTLATHDMARALRFYRAAGFALEHGGDDAPFSTLEAGASRVNLILERPEREWRWWGRLIFHHSDVDAAYAQMLAAGYVPSFAPRDAAWGERFFHITDPDGHELSFACPKEMPK